jgi:hypothetical protein
MQAGMQHRKTDKEADVIPDIVRSSRFIEQDEGWYFRTREDVMLGPYAEKFDAEISASLLIARLAQAGADADHLKIIHDFESDPANATAARVRVERGNQRIDVKAIKRRQQMDAAKGTLKKAWVAIAGVKSLPKSNKTSAKPSTMA